MGWAQRLPNPLTEGIPTAAFCEVGGQHDVLKSADRAAEGVVMGFGSCARVSIATLSMSTLVLFAGCSGEEHLGPVPIQKSRIKISPSQLDFEAFADLGQLTATRTDGQGRPSNLNNFVWRSLSPTIAQVDGAGRVVSLGQGTAIIEVSVGGESTRAEVVVDQVPVRFAVGRQADTLDAIGQKVTLSLEARDRNGFRIDRRSVDWSSNDPGIVTIDELGEVTSQGEGETTVVVRKRWRKDSTRVRVRRKPNAMTVLPAVDTIHAIGSTLRLRAYLTDSSGRVIEDDFFAWSSSDPSTVSVNNSGRVTGVSAGAAQIIARSSDLIGTAVIHVTPSAEQITITPSSSSIPTAGQTVQLSIQAVDTQGNAVDVSASSWASDRPGVAAVNSTGLVTGVGQGTARITATAPSGAKGFASVSVGQISLNVAPKSYTLSAVGDQTQLAIYPTDASGASATCPNPSWSSSNTKGGFSESTRRYGRQGRGDRDDPCRGLRSQRPNQYHRSRRGRRRTATAATAVFERRAARPAARNAKHDPPIDPTDCSCA